MQQPKVLPVKTERFLSDIDDEAPSSKSLRFSLNEKGPHRLSNKSYFEMMNTGSNSSKQVNQNDQIWIIDNLQKSYDTANESLKSLRESQKETFLKNDTNNFSQLEMIHNQLFSEFRLIQNKILQIKNMEILTPHSIFLIDKLERSVEFSLCQLSVYSSELRSLCDSSYNFSSASLYIVSQTFPAVITKSKNFDQAEVCLTLITGTIQTIKPNYENLQIITITDQKIVKQQNLAEIINLRQEGDYAYVTIKLSGGTRKTPIFMKFGLNINVNGNEIFLESQVSNPFIIITNECQYEESEGLLLKKIAFKDQNFVNWNYYANIIQTEFTRATKQSLDQPERLLSKAELDYLHSAFFNNIASISVSMTNDFWDWFGKFIQKIRYQRHIFSLWKEGLIIGLVPRNVVNQILINLEPGSFVVRFSEHNPGLFAIAYKIADPNLESSVRHYLIKTEEIGKKTLPDLLRRYSEFSTIVKASFDANGNFYYNPVDKNTALSPYYSKVETSVKMHDYDTSIKCTTLPQQPFGSSESFFSTLDSPTTSHSDFSFNKIDQKIRRNSLTYDFVKSQDNYPQRQNSFPSQMMFNKMPRMSMQQGIQPNMPQTHFSFSANMDSTENSAQNIPLMNQDYNESFNPFSSNQGFSFTNENPFDQKSEFL